MSIDSTFLWRRGSYSNFITTRNCLSANRSGTNKVQLLFPRSSVFTWAGRFGVQEEEEAAQSADHRAGFDRHTSTYLSERLLER